MQMIYDMLKSDVTDKTLAARMKIPLRDVVRYRLAVEKFYGKKV